MQIDLNCDLGESFGVYKIGLDEAAIMLVTSVNIACGWHAGDPNVMAETVKMATAHGVSIGCHPGFNDLRGFGRRPMEVTERDLKHDVIYQIGALNGFVRAEGARMSHVKPHGAMYNMAAKDRRMARAIAEAVYAVDKELILLGLANSQLIEAAKEIGLPYAQEGFADRRYLNDGSLVPRKQLVAQIKNVDEALEQAMAMVKNEAFKTKDGGRIALQVDSICIHGDHTEALEFIKALRKGLLEAGITLKGLGQ